MKNVIDKIKESYGHKDIKTKGNFDEMSLSRYKSINKSIYERMYSLKNWLKEQLKNSEFGLELPGVLEIDYYNDTDIDKIDASEKGDVKRIEASFKVLANIDDYIYDSLSDTKIQKFKNLVKGLILNYYKIKIFNDENVDIEIEDSWDGGIDMNLTMKSKDKYILR